MHNPIGFLWRGRAGRSGAGTVRLQWARVPLSLFLLVQALLLLAAQDSHAGVIIWLERSPTIEGETPHRDHLIEIIQGHNRWLSNSGQQFQPISQATNAAVDDLDKRVRTNIFYWDKKYSVEKPFPTPVDGVAGIPLGSAS